MVSFYRRVLCRPYEYSIEGVCGIKTLLLSISKLIYVFSLELLSTEDLTFFQKINLLNLPQPNKNTHGHSGLKITYSIVWSGQQTILTSLWRNQMKMPPEAVL